MRILQITPHLPPPFEGVGTYATALAHALEEQGIETRFLVPERSAEGLLAGIGDSETVLLHYAGYGYERRGCPTWLPEGLARWPGRLVTVFHEVWASGPPWTSSFWLLPRQRRIAAALARRSQARVTTLPVYACLLHPWAEDVRVMPVFSAVGEPAEVPAFGARARRLVIFGGSGVRARSWGPFLPRLEEAVRALGVDEVVDVGPPVERLAMVAGVPVRSLGVLPQEAVSALLLDSAAGFLAYPPDFLPKSTIYAAYRAHGMLPVCAWHGGLRYGDGTPGRDFAALAAEARARYLEGALPRQAARFRELLAP